MNEGLFQDMYWFPLWCCVMLTIVSVALIVRVINLELALKQQRVKDAVEVLIVAREVAHRGHFNAMMWLLTAAERVSKGSHFDDGEPVGGGDENASVAVTGEASPNNSSPPECWPAEWSEG